MLSLPVCRLALEKCLVRLFVWIYWIVFLQLSWVLYIICILAPRQTHGLKTFPSQVMQYCLALIFPLLFCLIQLYWSIDDRIGDTSLKKTDSFPEAISCELLGVGLHEALPHLQRDFSWFILFRKSQMLWTHMLKSHATSDKYRSTAVIHYLCLFQSLHPIFGDHHWAVWGGYVITYRFQV